MSIDRVQATPSRIVPTVTWAEPPPTSQTETTSSSLQASRSGDRADEGEASFLLGRQEPHRHVRGRREPFEQLIAVRGLPTRARDEHLEPVDVLAPGDPDELRDAAGRLDELQLGDPAVALDRRAEPEDGAPLVERFAVTRDEQADGIRADVDDPDRHHLMMKAPHVSARSRVSA